MNNLSSTQRAFPKQCTQMPLTNLIVRDKLAFFFIVRFTTPPILCSSAWADRSVVSLIANIYNLSYDARDPSGIISWRCDVLTRSLTFCVSYRRSILYVPTIPSRTIASSLKPELHSLPLSTVVTLTRVTCVTLLSKGYSGQTLVFQSTNSRSTRYDDLNNEREYIYKSMVKTK